MTYVANIHKYYVAYQRIVEAEAQRRAVRDKDRAGRHGEGSAAVNAWSGPRESAVEVARRYCSIVASRAIDTQSGAICDLPSVASSGMR